MRNDLRLFFCNFFFFLLRKVACFFLTEYLLCSLVDDSFEVITRKGSSLIYLVHSLMHTVGHVLLECIKTCIVNLENWVRPQN